MSSYATAAQSTGISQQHYQRATNPPPDRRTPQEIHYSNYYYGQQQQPQQPRQQLPVQNEPQTQNTSHERLDVHHNTMNGSSSSLQPQTTSSMLTPHLQSGEQSVVIEQQQQTTDHQPSPNTNQPSTQPSKQIAQGQLTLSSNTMSNEPVLSEQQSLSPMIQNGTQMTDVNNNDNDNKHSSTSTANVSITNDSPVRRPRITHATAEELMFHGTKCEVKCEETFAYYEGYIIDYFPEEKKFRILFEWKPEAKVPVHYIRRIPEIPDENWKPKEGDHVECKAKAEEGEPNGWWDCKISTVRDNLYLITYEGWENHHEVLQHSMLRPYNPHQPLINEHSSKVEDLKCFANQISSKRISDLSTNSKQYKQIQERSRLLHLGYRPDLEKILMIGTDNEISDACMLMEYWWQLIDRYSDIEHNEREKCKDLHDEYQALEKCIHLEFEFNTALFKYVIGRRGENIAKAKAIEEVKHVAVMRKNEQVSKVSILAIDEEAAQMARDILEIGRDEHNVPLSTLRELIGEHGEQIADLERRAHVQLICTKRYYYERYSSSFDDNDDGGNGGNDNIDIDGEKYVEMIIIGPKECLPTAKHMLQIQVNTILQRNKLLFRQNSAQQQIDEYSYANNYVGGDQIDGGRGGGGKSKRRMQRERDGGTDQSNKSMNDFNWTADGPRVTYASADINLNIMRDNARNERNQKRYGTDDVKNDRYGYYGDNYEEYGYEEDDGGRKRKYKNMGNENKERYEENKYGRDGGRGGGGKGGRARGQQSKKAVYVPVNKVL